MTLIKITIKQITNRLWIQKLPRHFLKFTLKQFSISWYFQNKYLNILDEIINIDHRGKNINKRKRKKKERPSLAGPRPLHFSLDRFVSNLGRSYVHNPYWWSRPIDTTNSPIRSGFLTAVWRFRKITKAVRCTPANALTHDKKSSRFLEKTTESRTIHDQRLWFNDGD